MLFTLLNQKLLPLVLPELSTANTISGAGALLTDELELELELELEAAVTEATEEPALAFPHIKHSLSSAPLAYVQLGHVQSGDAPVRASDSFESIPENIFEKIFIVR